VGAPMPEKLDPTAVDRLLEMAGGDREFVRELIGEYLSDAPGQIAALRDATGDELVRAAHTLKSTSATFGAARLAAICSDLERAARDGDRPADLVAAAEGEYAEVRPALESERARFA
jgi:HPt (histidine-containing phosphotransfer) domain-containing protein